MPGFVQFTSFNLHPGPVEGGGPAPTEAVRYTSCPATVSQLPQPGPVALNDLETDEATYAGVTGPTLTSFYSVV